MPNEESVKWGERGEIPDKMIVDPRLREDDEEGGAGMTRKDAGKTSRGKLAGTNSRKSFRLL